MRKSQGSLYYGWVIVAILFLILFVNVGSKNSFGVFMDPLLREFRWERATLSLTASLFLFMYGLSQPVVGWLVDRFSPKLVMAAGLLAMGIGIAALSWSYELWHFMLFYGLLAGLGTGLAAPSPASVIVSRWFDELRGRAVGLTIAGMAAGQMALPPLAMILILRLGWRPAFLFLGGLLLLLVIPTLLLVRPYPEEDVPPAAAGKVSSQNSWGINLQQAMHTRAFKHLCSTHFVCGFTVNLITIHFTLYTLGVGFSPMVAATGLGILGGLSMLGSAFFGALSDRFSAKNLLGLVFLLRAVGIVILLLAQSPLALYLTTALLGFSWVATIPLVTGLSRHHFGQANLGSILGGITFSHQVGGTLGAFLGGLLFDISNSYLSAFSLGILLCLLAAAISFLTPEQREATLPQLLPSARQAPTAG